MLPFLLITFLFTGCMAICSESIAGEKERGTIATLLITPCKRSHIVVGKMLSLGITGLASSLVSFTGLMLSLPNLLGTSFSFSAYSPLTIFFILMLIFVTVLLFTTLLMIISTFSKSVKEASTYASPLMIVIMLIGVTNMMNTMATTNLILYTIPVYNVIQCLIGVFSLALEPMYFIVCIGSNLIYIVLGIIVLIKMFNNEKIIFNM
jgi:sodium transport system permease protein